MIDAIHLGFAHPQQSQRSKKTIEKQSKVIDELRKELASTNRVCPSPYLASTVPDPRLLQLNQEQSTQVEKLKKQSRKCDEVHSPPACSVGFLTILL